MKDIPLEGENPAELGEEGDEVVREILERSASGKKIDTKEYMRQYPALAEKLEQLFEELELDEDAPSIHRVVGDFRIIREIGSGGMATVYEAEQLSVKRRVALKVLSTHLSLSAKSVQKFRREAEAGGRQIHPGIVLIYAVGEYEGVHYIAQELVQGGYTLADRLEEIREKDDQPKDYFRRTAERMQEVAEALACAHENGVIHRDVKPSNILLNREGRPKVTDFGLARVEDALVLSRTGEFAGTPFYMSPEQAMSRRIGIDHRTDIFSLGVTLYECLTLKRPFDGETSQEVLRKIMLHEPKNPSKANPRVPRDLSVICMKAMEKDPRHRYQSMKDMAADLRRYLEGEPILARPMGLVQESVKWIHRHKIGSIVVLSTLIALVSLAILMIEFSMRWREELRNAEERFKSIRSVVGWPEFGNARGIWRYYIRDEPEESENFIWIAIYDIMSGELELAANSLEECVRRCKDPEDEYIRRDACYLLGVVRLRLAEDPEIDPKKKIDLCTSAEEALEQAGSFDLLAPDTLVRHIEDRSIEASPGKKWFLREIRLNSDHYLVHLHHGCLGFSDLYKGGERNDFENTIRSFENVLRVRPDHVAALTCLGRTYYFFARFYNFIHLANEAKTCLVSALNVAVDRPLHFTEMTLGQLSLLLCDNGEALEYLERACRLCKEKRQRYNALRELAKVHIRLGRYGDAHELLLDAWDAHQHDVHTAVAFAEYYLHTGKIPEALEHAKMAVEVSRRLTVVEVKESLQATAYLARARIYYQQKNYREAVRNLDKILDDAVYSPRDLSLGCLLIASFPEDLGKEDIKKEEIIKLAWNMANRAIEKAGGEEGKGSALCLSALGAAHYLKGEYREAVDYLKRAMNERNSWPKTMREYHWTEDARDLYLLAMAHYRLSLASSIDEPKRNEARDNARACYEKAEDEFEGNPLPYEDFGVTPRIRDKARALLDFVR